MVVALTSKAEAQQLSAAHGESLELLSRSFRNSPRVVIQDDGLPLDDTCAGNFYYALNLARHRLVDGETVLIDSSVSEDATSTFLACLLCKLGLSAQRALSIVREAGCGPTSQDQNALIEEIASAPDFGTVGLHIGDILRGPNGTCAQVGSEAGGTMVKMIDPPAEGLFSLLYATKRILGIHVENYRDALRLWSHEGRPLPH